MHGKPQVKYHTCVHGIMCMACHKDMYMIQNTFMRLNNTLSSIHYMLSNSLASHHQFAITFSLQLHTISPSLCGLVSNITWSYPYPTTPFSSQLLYKSWNTSGRPSVGHLFYISRRMQVTPDSEKVCKSVAPPPPIYKPQLHNLHILKIASS